MTMNKTKPRESLIVLDHAASDCFVTFCISGGAMRAKPPPHHLSESGALRNNCSCARSRRHMTQDIIPSWR